MKKPKMMKVKTCYADGMSYMFTLSGEWRPASVMELRVGDELMAIVNVEPWDTEDTLIAHSIWFNRERFGGRPHDLFVDPYVRVAPLTVQGLERYMEAEGKQGITHTLYTSKYTYIVNRTNWQDRKGHYPWVCYCLDLNSETYSLIHEGASLNDMQTWLGEEEPQKKREIQEWHVGGRQIYNLLDYGVAADGITDDTSKVLRVINVMDCGDILYLPSGNRIRIDSREVVIPKGIVVDIHQDQFITEG